MLKVPNSNPIHDDKKERANIEEHLEDVNGKKKVRNKCTKR